MNGRVFYLCAKMQSPAFSISREVGIKEIIFIRDVKSILDYGTKGGYCIIEGCSPA